MIKRLFGYNFDEGWNFDDGANFDASSTAVITAELETAPYPPAGTYVAVENLSLYLEAEPFTSLSSIVPLDLLPLIPDKFHTSQLLLDYIAAVNIEVSKWIGYIDDLPGLKDPTRVGRDYIGQLAALIGLRFIGEETASLSELRNQLLGAIDRFKLKGTYMALESISRTEGYTVNIVDMYATSSEGDVVTESEDGVETSSGEDVQTDEDIPYSAFVNTDWFVADYVEENPPGLGSEYFKSPHFGVEVVLDKYYGGESDAYLWKDEMLGVLPEAVESVRPINTVPHYLITLTADTYENGLVYEIPTTLVATIVTDAWSFSRKYFDESWHIDDGVNFDQDRSVFLSSIVTCKLGTGHKGQHPTYTGFTLAAEVTEIAVESVTSTSSQIIVKVVVDADAEFSGLSEMVLCQADGTVVVASTFPDVDKTAGMELNIYVNIYP